MYFIVRSIMSGNTYETGLLREGWSGVLLLLLLSNSQCGSEVSRI